MNSSPYLFIDGRRLELTDSPAHENLLALLRRRGITGTKCGCNEGDCGACTVLLERPGGAPRAINSCLALVHSLAGSSIITVEGLASEDGSLHPAQRTMSEACGSQCGYCTPGFVCSLAEAGARGVTSDPAAVADQLCGNLCRCTGYRPIREAAAAMPSADVNFSVHGDPALSPSRHHRPTTLDEALELRSQHPDAMLVAGATEIAVLINKRQLRPENLISLERVKELTVIESTESHWHLGAAVPLTDLADALGGEYPALDQMLRLFASRQIRHRATLGGNLVTASPIGDSAPVLLALDASVILASPQGKRTLPLAEFFTGYRKTVLNADELLEAVLLPRNPAGRCTFAKVSKRREMDISTVSAAIRMEVGADGRIRTARLAFGGVAACPQRALAVEETILGLTPAEVMSAEMLDRLCASFTPLSDLRGTAEYRRLLLRELLRKHFLETETHGFSAPVIGNPFDHPQGSMIHESAVGHVTGQALFSEDIAIRRGALQVHLVRSNIACGKILECDISSALRSPGVRAVLTAKDIPGANNTGPARHDEPLFAEEEIHYHGQIIAAIIADEPEQARLAAEKVRVITESLPPLLGIDEAILAGSFHTDPHFLIRGDVSSALTECPHQLQGVFRIGGQEQFYLETHASLAESDGAGGIHVTASTQHPSETQTIVAEVLGWPKNRVVVECPRMGGGFGGKETQANPWAAICALGALRTGRPVAMQLDRDVDIECTGKRHPFLARYHVGFDKQGRLLAADIELYSDGGWSLDLSQPVNDRALFHLDNAYHIPHVRFRGQVCRTHSTSHTAFRGFGGPQGMLVIEEILGRIAEITGHPAEKVRETNFYHGEGETNTTHYGQLVEDNRLQRIWHDLLDHSDFATRRREIDAWNLQNPHRKRGLAITPVKFGISFTLKHYNQAGALVLIYQDGSVQVNHGGTEMGQGLHTKILGVAMRELGLPAERIRLMHTRTDKVPNTSATAASTGSDLNGMAVADACSILRERLAILAAEKTGCDPADIDFRDGHLHAPGADPIPFGEITALAYTRRIQLSATGFHITPHIAWDWSVGKGRPFHYYAFGAAVSEVEIDGFTGMHHLRRVDILHDVGDSLNPAIDRGQIEGAYVQGTGWLTCEELKWDERGRLLTHSASTYAIPAFSDAPVDFRVRLLDKATQPRTIHGSKAVGEPPLMLAISVREALRDAIHAFGIGETSLPSPLTAETVKLAIGPLPGHPVALTTER
ncbi:MAG: xanthine dehydrogenase molybdopterin binding subunit [Akkermansiaceae bacterium]|nr:xanthine dehydrogenase molybdopterin binding subunit [Akkermansiaceae bacterium]